MQSPLAGAARARLRPLVRAASAAARPPVPVPPSSAAALARNADADATAVVVGASRGLGLAVVEALRGRWAGRVAALCRAPGDAHALGELVRGSDGRMAAVAVDTTDEESVASAAAEVREFSGGRVDMLVHTAGLLHEKVEGGGGMPETKLAAVDAAFLTRNLLVNTVGPVLVMKHFAPQMRTARTGRAPSVIAALTARVGSIGDNRVGGWLSYRASKAAANQALRTASIELGRAGVVVVALHPGTVETELSAPWRRNVPAAGLFPVDVAAKQILDVIDALDPEADNGAFYDYAKKPIPW